MRLAEFLICIILSLSSPACCEPAATWTPQESNGMYLLSLEDGQWIGGEAGGREAVTQKQGTSPASHYLYFRLAPETRAAFGAEAYLAVDFLDKGVGLVRLHYNSDKLPYDDSPGFLLLDTGSWQRALIRLTNVKFSGSQNGGADFRLAGTGRSSIARVELYTDEPDLNIPSDKERAMTGISNIQVPKDMSYCFGANFVDESTALLYRSLGVTSVESYVTWETCERDAEGKWNWENWDKQVQILKDTGLKWVPFLILGPAYSTPNWFREGKDHFPCRCLEHGIDSKIESLWNPNLPRWIDRFISEFAKRYRDSGVIESVLLGIQGDFGEAIYSVTGGGWTFHVPGEYHNHAGYWCDDPHALADFRKFVAERYTTVAELNKAWSLELQRLEDADFPGRRDQLTAFAAEVESGEPGARRRWLDFIEWYRGAMTRWADWWIETTRQHFPDTPVYLCTGGDAEPRHGSNFAEQCRVAAKHKAGVRITNEASDYAANFAITRWVAAAGKHYGAYYGFEPAGAEDERGIVARIYNATASGANQLHDYAGNVTGSQERIEQQRRHLRYLFRVAQPEVPVALWYPNVSMTLSWGGYLPKAAQLRDLSDFDYVDETMLRTGALRRYKILVIIHGGILEASDARLLANWMKIGGRILVMGVPDFEDVQSNIEPEDVLFGDTPQGCTVGRGWIARVKDWDELAAKLRAALDELGLPVFDLQRDGIYGTNLGDGRFLFLNTTDKEATVTIALKGKGTDGTLPAGTITELTLKGTE